MRGPGRPAPLPKGLWYALGILLLLGGWTAGSLAAGAFIIPPPWMTLADTVSLLAGAYSWTQILRTVLRVCIGFLLALAAGALVGIPGGRRGWLQALFHPLVLFLQGMPPLLWAIPLILILGVSRLAPVLVIALICFPLIAVTLAEGMKSLPRSLEQMLRLFAPGRRALLRELALPHLRPFIASSLKLGLVLGIKASVTAEYFGANNGIGFQLQAAYQSMQVRRLFSWALLLLLLILAFNWLLGWLERLVKAAGTRQPRPARTGSAEGLALLKRSFLTQSGRAAIRLRQVGFAYPGAGPVLQGLELEVEPERIAVISGDSGIGKTTLLYLIASLLEPSAGRIERPASIGLVFQDDRLLPWRSNAWNAALPLIYSGLPPAESLSFAGYLLEEAGLGGREWEYPEALSGGMKKRLAFARCFARFPEAILLDEPFTGLDAEARRQLWQKFFDLLALHRGPVVVVTHFPEEIPCAERCAFYSLEPAAGAARGGDRAQRGAGHDGAPPGTGHDGDRLPAAKRDGDPAPAAKRDGDRTPAALRRVKRPGSSSAPQT